MLQHSALSDCRKTLKKKKKKKKKSPETRDCSFQGKVKTAEEEKKGQKAF